MQMITKQGTCLLRWLKVLEGPLGCDSALPGRVRCLSQRREKATPGLTFKYNTGADRSKRKLRGCMTPSRSDELLLSFVFQPLSVVSRDMGRDAARIIGIDLNTGGIFVYEQETLRLWRHHGSAEITSAETNRNRYGLRNWWSMLHIKHVAKCRC